ncbi:Secreted protein OS=Streptomyces tendae OX=1932 GN=GUR47_09845 PE=4 SV=1 [Streptomyces tendae]
MEARHSALCVEGAEDTVEELRAVLAEAGIVLPSLGLDPVSLAREAPCPLVELGRCSVETARRLAAALR